MKQPLKIYGEAESDMLIHQYETLFWKFKTWMMKNYTFVNCSFKFDGNNLKIFLEGKAHLRRSNIAFLGVFKGWHIDKRVSFDDY